MQTRKVSFFLLELRTINNFVLIEFIQLTLLQRDSNGWCNCENQQLGQTRGKIVAPCFLVLVYRRLYGQCMVVLKRCLRTQNLSRHVGFLWRIAAHILSNEALALYHPQDHVLSVT